MGLEDGTITSDTTEPALVVKPQPKIFDQIAIHSGPSMWYHNTHKPLRDWLGVHYPHQRGGRPMGRIGNLRLLKLQEIQDYTDRVEPIPRGKRQVL